MTSTRSLTMYTVVGVSTLLAYFDLEDMTVLVCNALSIPCFTLCFDPCIMLTLFSVCCHVYHVHALTIYYLVTMHALFYAMSYISYLLSSSIRTLGAFSFINRICWVISDDP